MLLEFVIRFAKISWTYFPIFNIVKELSLVETDCKTIRLMLPKRIFASNAASYLLPD